MHPETLFSASGKLALAGRALLFAPRWRWSQRIASAISPLALAAVYLVLIVLYFAKSPGGFGTLAQVTRLFQNPWLLLAGWIHYLAFDLFLGAWQTRQAQRLGISHFVVIPSFAPHIFVWPGPATLCFGRFALRWSADCSLRWMDSIARYLAASYRTQDDEHSRCTSEFSVRQTELARVFP